MINDVHCSLGYSYLVFDNDRNIDFNAGAKVSAVYFSTSHFPVQSYGQYNFFNLRGTLFAAKTPSHGGLNLTPGIEASNQETWPPIFHIQYRITAFLRWSIMITMSPGQAFSAALSLSEFVRTVAGNKFN
jgi:hypothetical protein